MADASHFDFPFRLDANGRPVVVEQDSPDHIAAQVAAALSTPADFGTPLRPTWGTAGLAFRQQPLDLQLVADELGELLPAIRVGLENDPALTLDAVAEGVARVNVYVASEG
jgi:hypothetical protein